MWLLHQIRLQKLSLVLIGKNKSLHLTTYSLAKGNGAKLLFFFFPQKTLEKRPIFSDVKMGINEAFRSTQDLMRSFTEYMVLP